MATYAIGDIQGCFPALQNLLEKIAFNPDQDELWLTGDLVNRGAYSLETLRFVKNLKNCKVVLGNHDLHLLARAYTNHPGWKEDTLESVLAAKDRDELIDWLRSQSLLHYDAAKNFMMVHAGLAPSWDLAAAKKLAHEVEEALQGAQCRDFLNNLYGNEPQQWREVLIGWDRLRCIVNYFTRLRFCHADGRLELSVKENVATAPHLIPWFKMPGRKSANVPIIFGHWAALGGKTHTPNTFALDTGCVWGFCLTAMRLEDQQRFHVPCEPGNLQRSNTTKLKGY